VWVLPRREVRLAGAPRPTDRAPLSAVLPGASDAGPLAHSGVRVLPRREVRLAGALDDSTGNLPQEVLARQGTLPFRAQTLRD